MIPDAKALSFCGIFGVEVGYRTSGLANQILSEDLTCSVLLKIHPGGLQAAWYSLLHGLEATGVEVLQG